MLLKTKNSVISRIGFLMVSLLTLAVVTMVSSVFITDLAQHDAASVNLSGSLRMQSYRLTSVLAKPVSIAERSVAMEKHISSFDETLSNNVMFSSFILNDGSALDSAYQQVNQQWQTNIKPLLRQSAGQAPNMTMVLNQIEPFVAQIDELVKQYQLVGESNIALLRVIQLAALFLSMILVYVSMHSIFNHIAMPLRELTIMADNIGRGNFTHIVNIDSEDELGLLAKTFNHTCSAISQMYGNLEERVKIKTGELQRSNRSLQLLFDTVKKVNDDRLTSTDFDDIIGELSAITSVKDIDLCLMTEQGQTPYQHLVSDEHKTIPNKCIVGDCSNCVTTEPTIESFAECRQMKFPLTKDQSNFGVLVCNLSHEQTLTPWQIQIIQSVAEQIAMAMSLKNQAEQARRIALMDERATIARELHDSLAQALSYLKIQVSRLQKCHEKQAGEAVMLEITDELKGGLSSAYRQLRELLTTFRLKIDTDGLKQALEQTIKQHQARSNMNLTLDCQLDNIPLSPNEEIHLLQIIREAVQNAVHHSKGKNVHIELLPDHEQKIHVCIKDDGIGIDDDPQKLNHYGLVIMKERSRHLSGDLKIGNNADGGVSVSFSFQPQYLEELKAS